MLNAQIIEPYKGYQKQWFGTGGAKYSDNKNQEQDLNASLERFQSHHLADLDKANLMDRVDVKFLLPRAFLPGLLARLQNYYSVLEINNQRISRYYNQYFDTNNLRFYYDHHNGKLNRYKVRQQTYLDTNTQFLEVKFKNNNKRTIKSRILCSTTENNDHARNTFIQGAMNMSYDDLMVSQQGGYQRIALANEASAGYGFLHSQFSWRCDLA
ncbi:VTC domain-containing protein [Paraglaciecola hydrolytica]|nr:VTC domain-containing protein [Paraglaciecola hydrolytica]